MRLKSENIVLLSMLSVPARLNIFLFFLLFQNERFAPSHWSIAVF